MEESNKYDWLLKTVTGMLISLLVAVVFNVSLLGMVVVILYAFIVHEKEIASNDYDPWWWLVIGGFLGEILFKV
jgi:uncharacterized membrane protein YdcZ (DUF606 family)